MTFTLPSSSYGLVTEQKRGPYKYFMDLGDRLDVVEPKTLYVDEVSGHSLILPLINLRTADRTSSVRHRKKALCTAWISAPCRKTQKMRNSVSGLSRSEAR